MPEVAIGVVEIELEIHLAARPERVWAALVEEIGRWWPRDFYAGPEARDFVLEARLGGRMYEDWGNGAGAIWYSVTEIDPPRSLGLTGQMPAAFGGPAISLLRLVLKPDGEGTLLALSDAELRRPAAETRASLEAGWRALFEKAFKSYVEGSGTPAAPVR